MESQRKTRKRKPSEEQVLEKQIQAEIVKDLQEAGIFCFHVPNEAGSRSTAEMMQLIAQGLRPGVADLVVWWPTDGGSKDIYVEVKTPTGTQKKNQETFEKYCTASGREYYLVRSADTVRQWIADLKKTLEWERFGRGRKRNG